MAATQTLPSPAPNVPFAHRTLTGALASGVATANGTTISEVLPCAFTRYITVRVKTATNGGTINLDFVRPTATDPAFNAAGLLLPAQCTKYVSPASPTAVTVTAGTETSIGPVTCNGESFCMISFTGSVGAGTITYVDVCGL